MHLIRLRLYYRRQYPIVGGFQHVTGAACRFVADEIQLYRQYRHELHCARLAPIWAPDGINQLI
jgi:hypothetical protein